MAAENLTVGTDSEPCCRKTLEQPCQTHYGEWCWCIMARAVQAERHPETNSTTKQELTTNTCKHPSFNKILVRYCSVSGARSFICHKPFQLPPATEYVFHLVPSCSLPHQIIHPRSRPYCYKYVPTSRSTRSPLTWGTLLIDFLSLNTLSLLEFHRERNSCDERATSHLQITIGITLDNALFTWNPEQILCQLQRVFLLSGHWIIFSRNTWSLKCTTSLSLWLSVVPTETFGNL